MIVINLGTYIKFLGAVINRCGRKAGLLLFVLFSVVMQIASATVSSAMTCEEALAAGGCISVNVSVNPVWDYTISDPPVGQILPTIIPSGGLDHTCAPMTTTGQQVTVVNDRYYNVASFKHYFDPYSKLWKQHLSAGGFFWTNEAQLEQWLSGADYVMGVSPSAPIPYYTPPGTLYPNGCSDIPPSCPGSPAGTAFLSACPGFKGSYDCATNTGTCAPNPCDSAQDNDGDGFDQCEDCDDGDNATTIECSNDKPDKQQGTEKDCT